MTFIKWIEIAEADRNLYLAMQGDNLLALTESLWLPPRIPSLADGDSDLVQNRLNANCADPDARWFMTTLSRNNRNYRSYVRPVSPGSSSQWSRSGRDKFLQKYALSSWNTIVINYSRGVSRCLPGKFTTSICKTNLICLSNVTKADKASKHEHGRRTCLAAWWRANLIFHPRCN